jgi:hypothetical protein
LSGYFVCLFIFLEPVPGTDGQSVEKQLVRSPTLPLMSSFGVL